jgi:glycosyltransferase involved in cell wall biosynthesis
MVVHVFNSCLVSGPETLVLPALPRLGRDVLVIFLTETRKASEAQKPIAYAQSLGLATRSIPVRTQVDLRAVRELGDLLRQLNPRIVHAHDVKASTYLHAASRGVPERRWKLISTHHGVRARSGTRARVYEEFYTRFVLPHFDRALVVCSSDRELLCRRGVPAEKIVVHLNGINRTEVQPAQRPQVAATLRRQWGLRRMGIPEESLILGFAARIAREKRLDRVLRVLRYVQELGGGALPDWRLLIFGVGPLERKLKHYACKLDLDRRVHWMGYRHGLGDEMAGFDLLLSLSDAEGLPINLLEAGWAATPVFATAIDGNLDLFALKGLVTMAPIEEGERAMAEKLMPLLCDPEMRISAGQRFQERVKRHFSGDRWLAQLREIYAQLSQ